MITERRVARPLSAKRNVEAQQVSVLDDLAYTFCFNEMPRLHLARLVVAFLARKARTTTLDLLARVSVLEGIAGKQPGSWMKDRAVARPAVTLVEAPAPRYRRGS